MEYTYKIGLIGLEGTGKTSIVLRLMDDYFSRSFKPSNGVFRTEYKLSFGKKHVTLCLNDFPGDYSTSDQLNDLLKSLDAILIISNNEYKDPSVSEGISKLIDNIRQMFAFKNPHIALVSNLFISEEQDSALDARSHSPVVFIENSQKRRDTETSFLPSDLTVEEEATKELARNNHVGFYRVSAYTGAGILPMFEDIARLLMEEQDEKPGKSDEKVVRSKKHKCFCCIC